MNKENLKGFIDAVQENVGPYLSKKNSLQIGFKLELWSGIPENDKTPTAVIRVEEGPVFKNDAHTIEDGVRDIISQLRAQYCAYCISHNVEIREGVGYGNLKTPFMALQKFVHEVGHFAVLMSNQGSPQAISRNQGPTFSITLNTISSPRIVLYFAMVTSRYRQAEWYNGLFFESDTVSLADGLNDVLSQVRSYFAEKSGGLEYYDH